MNIRVCPHNGVTTKVVPATAHVGVEVRLLQCVGAELSTRGFKSACLGPSIAASSRTGRAHRDAPNVLVAIAVETNGTQCCGGEAQGR